MNATNVLLSLSALLLIVSFGFSVNGMAGDSQSETGQKAREDLAAAIFTLGVEDQAIIREFEARQKNSAANALIAAASAPADTITDETRAEIEELEASMLAFDNDSSENETFTAQPFLSAEKQQKSAQLIESAPQLGTVTVSDKETALVIFEPNAEATFTAGQILSVRRATGIIGSIQVNRLDDSGVYVATMRPHGFSPDGYPDIKAGDAIITPLEK